MGRKAPAALDDSVHRAHERRAAEHCDPRAAGPSTVGNLVGVALHEPDLLECEPEPFRDELAKHRLVPLTVRMGAEGHGGRPGGIECDGGPLVRYSGRLLDGVGDTEASQPASGLGSRAARREALDVDGGKRLVHVARELAAVVAVAESGLERHRLGRESDCAGAARLGRFRIRARHGR